MLINLTSQMDDNSDRLRVRFLEILTNMPDFLCSDYWWLRGVAMAMARK